jgi:hypothetical protein
VRIGRKVEEAWTGENGKADEEGDTWVEGYIIFHLIVVWF